MSKSKRLIVLILAIFFAFSSMLISCGKSEDGGKGDPTNVRTALNVDNSQNHQRSITETSDYLIQNGQTQYKIVIPVNKDTQIDRAVSELTEITREATGVLFETITDDKIVEGEDKYISFGDTELVKNKNLTIDYTKLGTDGYQIKTVGKTVFVLADNFGCKHGAYELLNDWFNYEYFYIDYYSLNKTQNVKLKNYSLTEIPDIPYRAGGYGTMQTSQTTISRYKMRIYPEFFVKIGAKGEFFHNSFSYLPISEHGITHSKWYNSTGDQLCYTAHGDQAEYDAMIAESVRVLKEGLIKYPDLNIVTYSIQDNTNTCNCDKCLEVTEEYGAPSAILILFLNDINREIREWFNGEGAEYKRDLKLCFFAYFKYVLPPATYNQTTGEFEANKGLRCDDGVGALIAPIDADYTESFDAEENNVTKDAILGWQAVTNDIATWFYDTLYTSVNAKFSFYNTFNGMQNRYQYAYDAGSIWMFNQGNDTTYGGQTVFGNFKLYLASKFGWNVNEDYQTLQTKFFDNMYQNASSTMFKLFNEMQGHFEYMKDVYNENGDCFAGWDNPKYWPKNTVLRWKGYVEQAIKEIEPLKATNPDLYEKTYSHVIAERLALNYLLFTHYDGHLSDQEVEQFKSEFKHDTEVSGNTMCERILAGEFD